VTSFLGALPLHLMSREETNVSPGPNQKGNLPPYKGRRILLLAISVQL
jgi:hypothetical protein